MYIDICLVYSFFYAYVYMYIYTYVCVCLCVKDGYISICYYSPAYFHLYFSMKKLNLEKVGLILKNFISVEYG